MLLIRLRQDFGGQGVPHLACRSFQRRQVAAGIILLAIGIAWPVLGRIGLGRLSGDIVIARGNFRFYFPIVTSLLISAILTLAVWLFRR